MIGYKTVKKDGTSLNSMFRYDLSGKWQTVPGNGSYVAKLGGGLFVGGYGEILVEIEARDLKPDMATPAGVRCYRRTRIRRLLPWTSIPPEQGKWRYWAACDVPGLSVKDRRELVMSIPPDQGEYRYWAALYVPGLPVKDRRELVMKIPVEYGRWRYDAALYVPGLTDEERRELVMKIPVDQGEYRYQAARYVKGLTVEDKRILRGEA